MKMSGVICVQPGKDCLEGNQLLDLKKTHYLIRCLSSALLLSACAASQPQHKHSNHPSPHPVATSSRVAETQTGIASLYWQGTKTASGQRLNPGKLTAAHRRWPFNSKVRVTNLNNGQSVVVTINDRGPFTKGRVIDLTPAAGNAIGFTRKQGITKVKIERLN